ncbi:MFS transporter [Streptomyces sp. AV19]|uniref:MFS transporter n=1 Tax=Streptomyces sp. AV19 TaxID=2793068 RepID=UPI0018FF04CA|nr:MFS transporter [Streptomyces sp. AV19]MBH1933905.1 MFS transporter [Streptomyces sp. AV19]MDG4535606.1 MFS transporter [Streptomyces sp. AV19]
MTSDRRWLVLGICCSALLLVSLDNTILNVALPSLRTDLHASVSGLQWTIDAYVVVLASLLMLSGSMADRFGRRRVFLTGLVLFTAGSTLCSLAPGLGWLIAFRAVQAVGGSMLSPVAMSIVTNIFTDPKERARAIGIWGGVVGISMAAGPIVGGALVGSVGWRSVFWINVPVGLGALALTLRFVPESRASRPRRFDPAGQLLMILLLGSLIYGIIEGAAVFFGIAAAALVALLVVGTRRAEPLVEPRLFRSAPLAGATLAAVCVFAALAGFLFLTMLHLQERRGLSALSAGVHLLPMAVMCLVLAPVSGRLVGARGPRLPLVLAGVALTGSGLLFAVCGAESSDPLLFTAFVLFGAGFGLVNAPITNTAVSGLPRSRAGVAAALASTSRQIGTSLGVAVVGAHVGGVGWWIITGCGLAVLALGTITTGRWAARTAERAAARLDSDGRQQIRVPVTRA